MFVYAVKFRPFSIILGIIVLSILFGGGKGNAAGVGGDPTQTTTAADAQADPIWAELGYTTVGQPITDPWQTRDYWNATHTYTTPGSIEPVWADTSSRALPVRFKHMFNGTEISSMRETPDLTQPAPAPMVVQDWLPGNTTLPGRVGSAVVQAFAVDPVNWVNASILAPMASTMLRWVTTSVSQAVHPDLSAAWFIQAYQMTFGLGFLLWGFIAVTVLARGVKSGEPGDVWGRELGFWSVAFAGGCMVGPLVGQLLIDGAGFLADGIVTAFGGGGAAAAAATITHAVANIQAGPTNIGGAGMTLLLLLILILALMCIVVVLVGGGAVAYLAGALFPLPWAWVTSPEHRKGSFRIVRVFVTVVAAKPALFLLIGIGMDILGGIAITVGIPPDVVTVITAAAVFLTAAFAPQLIWSYLAVAGGAGHGNLPPPAGGQAVGAVADGLQSTGRAVRGAARMSQTVLAAQARSRAQQAPATAPREFDDDNW